MHTCCMWSNVKIIVFIKLICIWITDILFDSFYLLYTYLVRNFGALFIELVIEYLNTVFKFSIDSLILHSRAIKKIMVLTSKWPRFSLTFVFLNLSRFQDIVLDNLSRKLVQTVCILGACNTHVIVQIIQIIACIEYITA